MKKLFLILTVIGIFYWLYSNSNGRIIKLLKSSDKNDLILGAYKAGESGEEEFVPLLLTDCNDARTTHSLRFKGISVYQAKMTALKKISKISPPVQITYRPDSSIINFYIYFYQKKHLIALRAE